MGCVCGRPDLTIGEHEYKILMPIAVGGFSQLFLVEDYKNGQKWALKSIECHSRIDVGRVRNEIEIHRRFGSHPHILNLECFSDEETIHGYRFSLIFAYYKRGSLQDELSRRHKTSDYIDEARVLQLFSQIVSALRLLHSSSPPIAHRDVKPANVLLSDKDQPVLMDFGSCFECPIFVEDGKESRKQLDEAGELCSMPYRAPELFVCEVGSVIDQSVDIWSLGCLLYALCFFESPFDSVHERGDSIALAVQSGKLVFPESHPYSLEVLGMIKLMIAVNPKDRIDINTLSTMINNLREIRS